MCIQKARGDHRGTTGYLLFTDTNNCTDLNMVSKHVQFVCHPRVFVVQNFRIVSNHAKCESWQKHVRFLCHPRVFVVRNFRILPNRAKAWIVTENMLSSCAIPVFSSSRILGWLPIMPSVNPDRNMFGSYAIFVFSSSAILGYFRIVQRHGSWMKYVQFLCHPRVFVVQNF